MKQSILAAGVIVAALAVKALAQNPRDTYYCGNPYTPCVVIGAVGSHFGQMGRISEELFGVGFGTSLSAMGTTSLSWDTSGNVKVPAGTLSVASSTTAGYVMRFLGAFTSKPTSHNMGDFYFDVTNHTLAMSTATFANSSSGWVEATQSSWTSY